jgi:L-seryl-tRNA(Ser) seleniumtransferase
MTDFYEGLGVAPVVNAATTFTALGGSLMPDAVLDAMRSAAGGFIDMHDLHLAAGRRLAELTRNEAAYVTAGCGAAMVLSVLAARNRGNPGTLAELPGHDRAPHEVVMHAAHRIPYDVMVQLAGGTIRQIGNIQQTFAWELEHAITDRTAAVLYVAGSHLPQVALPLAEVVEIAHRRDVPVIVDAAAQLPPVQNLWQFTRDLGADVALFSGGKALRGPQASGLMVGRPDLVEAARQNGAPYQRLGRPMKAGKEEIAGLVAAVDRFVHLDHDRLHAQWSATVAGWADQLASAPGVRVTREELNEAGQPVPRLHVGFADRDRAGRLLAGLELSRPRVAVLPDLRNGVPHGFWLGPDLLQPGEDDLVLTTISTLLDRTP